MTLDICHGEIFGVGSYKDLDVLVHREAAGD